MTHKTIYFIVYIAGTQCTSHSLLVKKETQCTSHSLLVKKETQCTSHSLLVKKETQCTSNLNNEVYGLVCHTVQSKPNLETVNKVHASLVP